ncbi:MAG: DegV family protein [Lachnospiraceae bacterium]|nr:DegV family protein [Lachnospiraceae bacterium]
MADTKFTLCCCSTADEKREFFEELNIPVTYFHFRMDEKDYPDDLGETIPFDKFYQHIREGAMPVTSQINTSEYCEFWKPELEKGNDIIHLTLSSGISGTINSANIAADMMREEYPDRRIEIVDSLAASSGYGLLMRYIAKIRDEGKTVDEALQWIEENKLRVHHWFFTSDLTHLKRGGRVSAASAAFGTLLKICPILNVDYMGRLIPRFKIRTKQKAIKETVKLMEEHAENGLDYDGFCEISNSDCLEDAEAVRDLIEEKFPNLKGKVIINSIGTVIGSHTGPGTVALFFMGDPRVD